MPPKSISMKVGHVDLFLAFSVLKYVQICAHQLSRSKVSNIQSRRKAWHCDALSRLKGSWMVNKSNVAGISLSHSHVVTESLFSLIIQWWNIVKTHPCPCRVEDAPLTGKFTARDGKKINCSRVPHQSVQEVDHNPNVRDTITPGLATMQMQDILRRGVLGLFLNGGQDMVAIDSCWCLIIVRYIKWFESGIISQQLFESLW